MQLAIAGEETHIRFRCFVDFRRACGLPRPLVLLFGVIVAWLLTGDLAFAQGGGDWPPFPLPDDPKAFPRGPGFYFSMWKISLFLLLFLIWVKTTDWVNQDCQRLRLNYGTWNAVVFGVFFCCVLLTWLLPWFAAGFLLMLLGFAIPLGLYVRERNQKVSDERKVMTAQHFRYLSAAVVNKLGGKMDVEKKAPHELGPPVKLIAQGASNEQANQANLISARQVPAGFVASKELIDQAVKMRAEQIMLEYSASTVGVKYQIDGVWHNHAAMEREKADPMLAVLKTLSNLKAADRVSRQSGNFMAEIGGKKLGCSLHSQGTPAGEAAIVSFEQKKLAFSNFDQLGMRGKMQEQVKELLGSKSGFILVSSMPAGGMTTTFDVLMATTDRFMRNFAGIEDEAKHERDIENILMTRYDSRKGETPMDILPKLIRTYPDVFVIRELVSGETVDILSGQVLDEQRLVYSSIRAKDATEALLRVLMLKADPQKFSQAVAAVLNVRLVRKLCEKCKEAYAPPPEVLKQLGLPVDKVQALYRPPVPPPPESEAAKQYKPYEECLAIGYLGRTAIFELAIVDDGMRRVLAQQPKVELLREASRKAGNRNLQEEGVLLVARGVTSVQELVRVLKQ